MEESEYLQPDFDPKTLKVAQLRNILLQNDVEYMSSAKKADLVALFNTKIKPTATKRLKMLDNIVANDDTIETVEFKSKTNKKSVPHFVSISDENDEEIEITETKKTPKTKKLAKVKSPTPEEINDGKASVIKRKSKKGNHNSDLESEISDVEEHKSDSEDNTEKPRSHRTKRVASKIKSVGFEKEKSLSPRKKSTSKKPDVSPSRITRSISGSSNPSAKTESIENRDRYPIRNTSRRAKSEETTLELESDKVISTEMKDSETPIVALKVEHFNKSTGEDNIFQKSSNTTTPVSKNPKKRSAEDSDDKKQTKHQKIKPIKSSTDKKLSPDKSSLKIDKFETPLPTSNSRGNLFEVDDESFEKALERSPSKKTLKKAKEVVNPDEKKEEHIHQEENSLKDNEIPLINTSSNSYEIPDGAPIKRNEINSFIPSIGKISPKINKILQFNKFSDNETTQTSNEESTTITEDTHDLLKEDAVENFIEIEKEFAEGSDDKQDDDNSVVEQEEDEDQEDSIFKNDLEDELNAHPNDDDIQNLQKEIQSTERQILEEAEEAARVVNQVLESENASEKTEESQNEEGGNKLLFNFHGILDFLNSVLFFGVLIFISIGALWYREQRILIGYCGSEIYQPSIPNPTNDFCIKVNDFLDNYKPSCLPCPENAICLPSMKIKCKADFVIEEPWYKVYGLLPFSDRCIKDTKKEKIIKEVVAKSLELLRLRNANYKCGDGNNEEDLERIGITDEELYEYFFRTKRSTVTDEDFNELWGNVLSDLSKEPEITVRQVNLTKKKGKEFFFTKEIFTNIKQLQHRWSDYSSNTDDDFSTDETASKRSVHQKSFFRSTSTVKLSVHCKFQKDVKERFEKYKFYILSISALFVSISVIYFQIVSYLNQKKRIHEISEVILGKLMRQQKFSIDDSTGSTHRYLSTLTLRDELLVNLSTSKKIEMWNLILKNLEANANVRSMTKEIHGEIVKVLEWIG